MEFSPAIAANPFVSFFAVATESGTIGFRWTGDEGFLVEESGRHRRGMTAACASALVPGCCGLRRVLRRWRRARRQAPLGLPGHGRGAAEDAGRRHGQSRHAVRAARRRGSGEARRAAANKSCADCHGAAATSMKGVAARYPAIAQGRRQAGRSRRPHQALPHRPTSRPSRWRRRAASCWRSRPIVAPPVARPADRAARRSAAGAVSRAGRGDLPAPPGPAQPQPAPSATTTMPARSCAGVDHSGGASHRLSDLPAGMAGARLAEAPAAQLPGRHPRRSLSPTTLANMWRSRSI